MASKLETADVKMTDFPHNVIKTGQEIWCNFCVICWQSKRAFLGHGGCVSLEKWIWDELRFAYVKRWDGKPVRGAVMIRTAFDDAWSRRGNRQILSWITWGERAIFLGEKWRSYKNRACESKLTTLKKAKDSVRLS